MKKWEYITKNIYTTNLADLNALGEEGWELIAVTDHALVLKRQKPSDAFDLRKFRKSRRMTQEELAVILGCSKGFVSQVENGRARLPYDKEQLLKEMK